MKAKLIHILFETDVTIINICFPKQNIIRKLAKRCSCLSCCRIVGGVELTQKRMTCYDAHIELLEPSSVANFQYVQRNMSSPFGAGFFILFAD